MVKSAALPALSACQPPQSLVKKLILIRQVWFGPSGPAGGPHPARQAAGSLPCGGETLGELGRKGRPSSQRVLTPYRRAGSGRGVQQMLSDSSCLQGHCRKWLVPRCWNTPSSRAAGGKVQSPCNLRVSEKERSQVGPLGWWP